MLQFSEEHWRAFRKWLFTPLGQAFLETEASQVAELVPTLFGYHLLLMGEPQFVESILLSPIHHRVWVHPYLDYSEKEKKPDANRLNMSALSVRFDKLSISNDTIDVIYLAHCLERIANPHEVLREVYRVLLPEGYLIVTGINPWSIWGFVRYFFRYFKPLSWDGHFISVLRMSDWLSLLGFEICLVKRNFFRPPFSQSKLLQRLKFLETVGKWCWPFWGAGYTILAKKSVSTMIPIKPQWQKNASALTTGIVAETRNV